VAILKEGGFALEFGEEGHHKRLILTLQLSFSSLFHDLGAFSLDLNRGERKPDLELLGCIFLILLCLYDFLAACARSRSWTGNGCTRHQG
jgi:hypothetical protein